MCITAKLIVEWQRLGPFLPDRHAPDALGMSASLRSLPKFGTRASLNLACRTLVPAFPQRSPPSLLTTAACGGLRSTPDCRPRRALLHLSYSCAPPCGPAVLVTQDPVRTSGVFNIRCPYESKTQAFTP